MDNKDRKPGKIFTVVSSALFGGGIGIFADFIADKDILFTALFLIVGLFLGVIKVCKKK